MNSLFTPFCNFLIALYRKLLFDQRFNQGRISQNQEDSVVRLGSVHVQCFPIYSILTALNQTTVDYFSLDIEGDELAVLKTIPWDRVNIKVKRPADKRKTENSNFLIFLDAVGRVHSRERRKRRD